MSKGDALAIDDFERTHFSATDWLDVSKSKCIGKSKKPDPNCLFNIFGELLDCDAHSVCDQAMSEISDNFNHYSLAATVVLSMRKQNLIEWLSSMCKYDTPGDEIVLYALSRLTRVHSIVYSKTATWCTIAVAQPMLPSDLHKVCTVRLMYLGRRGFGELVQKPSFNMPVYSQVATGEFVYSSGYYEEIKDQSKQSEPNAVEPAASTDEANVTHIEPEVPPINQGNASNERPENVIPNILENTVASVSVTTTDGGAPGQETPIVDISNPKDVVLSSINIVVPSCDSVEEELNKKPGKADSLSVADEKATETCVETGLDPCDHPVLPPLNFPLSSAVCSTSTDSALNGFNPLEESEPNLDLDMIGQNTANLSGQNMEDPMIMTKDLVNDAMSKIWRISVRKLTPEEVDFLSGPKLLPGLFGIISADSSTEQPTNKLNVEDSDATIAANEGDQDQDLLPTNVNPPTPLQVDSSERPKRKCTVRQELDNSPSQDDTDKDEDYLPNVQHHRRAKPGPSVDRIRAREHDRNVKNKKLKLSKESVTEEFSDHDGLKQITKEKSVKGKIDIKTYGIPKTVKERKMKCPSCPKICSSTKERNDHHKSAHGNLSCAVCNEQFSTPSALDKHKYVHTERKFKCIDCNESYPFKSQLKEHRLKHQTSKSFQCMSAHCGKWFKMESSLKKHVKIHDGVVYKCRVKKKCDYKNTDIRNVRAHEKTHSKILGYGCEKCGKTFKYWMQMDRHVKGKKCDTK